MQDHLFVYGTLMRTCDDPMARRLSAGANFLGEASCRGRLYLVKHYPGFLLSDDPADIVYGELYRLHAPAVALMVTLDNHEGCGPQSPRPMLYVRQRLAVTLADGGVSEAWIYIYNRPVTALKRIESGRFLER